MAASVLTEVERQEIEKQYDEILKACIRCKTEENKKLIRKAFDIANEAHQNIRRKSGEPYIYHPIEVAKIVAGEIGLGTKSVVCALLHDTVEDTDYTVEDIERMFSPKIASIIDGLTKISHVFDQNSSLQAENFRKMLLTLSDDVRVILIKLADRLHNMRTLQSMPRRKQIKIAGETLFLYAPLAHRLGLYAIKTELEDLSLHYEHPSVYEDINEKIKATEKGRIRYINKFSLPIIDSLNKLNINYNIIGRPKSIYSIWSKMKGKNVPFEEVYDIFAIRIVFDATDDLPEKNQCWDIYSAITDIYQPNPDRLRDWISTPKANGYEALHTTVMGPDGKWVEVQIRSRRMDEIAERGYAAHWKYKGDKSEENQLDEWIKKIRKLLESPESNALEFLDEFKMNLFTSEIFVFTPKGLLVRLPKDATALDFAYEIHSEIGNHAIGAKVNHRLVPLSHVLTSGDQVEILSSDKQKPLKEWMKYAKTAKARSKIRDAFKSERRKLIAVGKTILEDRLRKLDLHPNSEIFKKLFAEFGVTGKDELYEKIGNGNLDLSELKEILRKKQKAKWIRYWQLQLSRSQQKKKEEEKKKPKVTQKPLKLDKKRTLFLRDDQMDSTYKIAECCNPIPGDTITGFIEDDTVVIHKTECGEAIKLMSSQGDSIISVEWTSQKILSFLARIKLTGIDEIGLVNKVTNIISDELSVNMRTIYFTAHNGIFDGHIDVYVHDTASLEKLISDLKKIKGIKSVARSDSFED
ncbi:MAG: GTP pyrophosphokinase [Marinilabiliales bacterium]|nr:MAG: GTP pyrophosphokinase [Marinilabiliales bacterium]